MNTLKSGYLEGSYAHHYTTNTRLLVIETDPDIQDRKCLQSGKLQMVLSTQSIVPLLSYTHYPVVYSSLTLPLNFSHYLIFSTWISFQLSLSFLKSQNLWTVFGSSLQQGYFAFCILELYHDFMRRFDYLSQWWLFTYLYLWGLSQPSILHFLFPTLSQ